MNTRRFQLAISVAVAAGLIGSSPFARATPDSQPESAARPVVEPHGHGDLVEARDLDDARHERWERAAYLGVATSPAQPALRQQLHLPRGVGLVIDFIEHGSPADEAGLHQYDVLQKFDDQVLVNPQQLAVLVRIREAGDSVKLTVVRDGKALPIDVKLAEKEVPPLEELRLGNAEPVGVGVPMIGENDWPALANVPERRVGQTTFPQPQSDGALHIVWNDGSADLAITGQGTHRFLVFRDKAGHILFSGPIDTAEQREAIPKELRQRLGMLPEPFKIPGMHAAEPATRPDDAGRPR